MTEAEFIDQQKQVLKNLSPFNWRQPDREVPKEFKPRNDKPGKPAPMVLPGTPRWVAPSNQKRPK